MVGERIRAYRLQKKMKQTELAKALGVTKQVLWNWEHGVARLPIDNLIPIANVLEIDPMDLLEKPERVLASN